MKKIEEFIATIGKEVEARAIKAINSNDKSFNYEKEIGDTIITIDFQEHLLNGWLYADYDINVVHEDGRQSPNIEAAIHKVMPNWFELKA